jgi:hypothetical protein
MKHKLTVLISLASLFISQGINLSWGSPPPNPTTSDIKANTAGGTGTLAGNIGGKNTGFGFAALTSNTTGGSNTAIGAYSLQLNTTGSFNSAIGQHVLAKNITGQFNTGTSYGALFLNTTGTGNSAYGAYALDSNVSGSFNTAVGFGAGSHSTGNNNTGFGYFTLTNLLEGSNNLGIGTMAGSELKSGNNNIYFSNAGVPSESNTIRIGSDNIQTRMFLVGVRGKPTGLANAVDVVIDTNGQLGTINSSARYKKDIRDMNESSHKLLNLRPVTYHYKEPTAHGEYPLEYGLIAEEVATVYPDLVAYGADGKIETVQYHKLTPMLLNEIQHISKLLEVEKLKNHQQAVELADLKLQTQEVVWIKKQFSLLQTRTQQIENDTSRLSRIKGENRIGLANDLAISAR